MVSSIGYSLGAGSGIDTKALIEELAAAAREPKEARIKAREDLNQAQISAVAEASSAISSFASALANLVSGGSLQSQPSVSEPSLLAATARTGARIGSLGAEIEVRQLAQGQTLVSAPLGAATAPVGEGELTIATGSTNFTVTIDATNNSLEALAKAINDAKEGLSASIVNEGSGARLVLKGQTGEANAFTISVPEGTSSGLERFAYGPDVTGGLTASQAARDAIVIYEGVEVRRASNTITDLVPGVDLDLKKAQTGTIVRLGITRPNAAIKQAMQDFVAAYNELHDMLSSLSSAGTGGSEAGPLRGDVGVRDMQRQLARIPATILNSAGGPKTLAEIGIATARDGSLSLRTDRLERALADDPDGVEALFNPTQYTDSPFATITSAQGKVKPGTYTITDIVPATGTTPASARINGKLMIASGEYLVAPSDSPAVGLVVRITGAASTATITVDAGLAGAIKSISDTLLGRDGPLENSRERLSEQTEDIADAREVMERRHEAYYNQLVKTYATMERQVSAFKATQSYLEQQIKAWNGDND